MGMILRIASSRIVGQGDIVGRSGYFSLNLSANSVMRGRLDARRTLKSLVADLRIFRNSLTKWFLFFLSVVWPSDDSKRPERMMALNSLRSRRNSLLFSSEASDHSFTNLISSTEARPSKKRYNKSLSIHTFICVSIVIANHGKYSLVEKQTFFS